MIKIVLKYTISIAIFFTIVNANTNIKDLEIYPQLINEYSKNIDNKLMDKQRHIRKKYFSPWHWKKVPYSAKDSSWVFSAYKSGKYYSYNKQLLKNEWFLNHKLNSNFKNFLSLKQKAISINRINLRNFPTNEPMTLIPTKPGEGLTFDYLQNSAVHIYEPLLISHYSLDKAWVYVMTSYAAGWTETKNIAYLNEEEIKALEKKEYLFVYRDNKNIYDLKGKFKYKTKIGMFIPMVQEMKTHYISYSIKQREDLTAEFNMVKIPKYIATRSILKFKSNNLNLVLNDLLKSKYGWGGSFDERDCSSTLKDFLTPFGIWLPRNSSQQARIGKVFKIKNLSNVEKIEKIKKEAIPFQTLIHKKGHILLYLGVLDGNVMVLHNVWGVKTKINGKEGRKVIGHAIISTLELGKEVLGYDESSSLISTIDSFNIITKM